MARYTEAYSGIVSRLPEVETLYKLADEQTRRLGPLRSAPVARPLCRAAIVLLSSHIEGYVEDLAEVILRKIFEKMMPKSRLAPRFRYYFSKDILDEIRDTTDPDRISQKMARIFDRDSDIWCDSETFFQELSAERFVSGFSTPRFDQIQRFVRRFGYRNYNHDLKVHLQANYSPCVNMVNNVVDQRNKIAHGDIVATTTPNDLADMMSLVRIFCRSTDLVVGNWFRSIGCPIR